MPTSTRQIQLVARPHGEPTENDFQLVHVELDDPGPGQLLVRNLVMSVDPYMRGRMNDAPSYAPPWQLGEPAQGGAVGAVVASADPEVSVGAVVVHNEGWREHALLGPGEFQVVGPLTGMSSSLYLGALGMTGLTAYAGLFRIAAFSAKDTVFVSGAAGAVGSMVGQLAKLQGSPRVIGSAGSPEKVRHLLEDLGFDAAFDYHDGPVSELLARAAPEGVDVFFDNVGGEHLEAAIDSMNVFGRAAICGSISVYNATERPTGPRNMSMITGKRLTLRGFLVYDNADLQDEFDAMVRPALAEGRLIARETVVDGLDNAVSAFIGMLRGVNTGKMIVRLAPDPS
ncbi:MAG: NADP-dependent oxidoreductase [Jatrophihabitans sp.]